MFQGGVPHTFIKKNMVTHFQIFNLGKMKNAISFKNILFAITTLIILFPAGIFAQEEYYERLEKVRTLPLDSAAHGIVVHYPEGGEERARELGPMLGEALEFFSDSLGVDLDFRLALLKEEHWKELTEAPYAIPHVKSADSQAIAFLPLEQDGVVYDLMISLKERISPNLMKKVVETGLTYEEFARKMVDLIGFHEIGHPYAGIYGIGSPSSWFNEFVANYFLYAFLRPNYPKDAHIWDLSTRIILDDYEPKYRTLEDFEKYYVRVGADNYGWYQANFESKANDLYEERGFSFLRELKENFPEGEGKLSNEVILARLEKIAPGFKKWAKIFEEKPEEN